MGRRHGRGRDGAHDLAAGLVALDPRDPGAAVGRFQALGEAAVRVAVEGRAERRQPAHRVWTLAGKNFGHGRIDQSGAGRDGVGGVGFRVIAGRQGRGDTALRPGGRTAVQQRRGAQHQRLARGAGQGGAETGQARPDDQHAVMADGRVGAGHSRPAAMAMTIRQSARATSHIPTLASHWMRLSRSASGRIAVPARNAPNVLRPTNRAKM